MIWFVCPFVCLWHCISDEPLGQISCTPIYKLSIDAEKYRLRHIAAPVHPRRAYGGSRSILPSFLTTALYGRERSTSRPGHFTPGSEPVPIEWKAAWAPEPVWRREVPIWHTDPQVLSILSSLHRCYAHVCYHKVSNAQNIPWKCWCTWPSHVQHSLRTLDWYTLICLQVKRSPGIPDALLRSSRGPRMGLVDCRISKHNSCIQTVLY